VCKPETIMPTGSNFIKFGNDEVPNRRQAVVNEQPENNRRSATVSIDPALRKCHGCSVLVNIGYAKAVIEGWLCQECYVFRGEDRTPFCIHCCKRSGKDRVDTVRGWACQRCHRGATIAAVS
jgi:hypothetical protein